ncbi:MAG: class I SAM-dependent methyltransferase [Actinomycetota bacterium]
MEPDPQGIETFLEQVVGDIAAATHAATVVAGEKLGLCRAMAEGGPQTPDELAARTGCSPRMLREWLNAQAASGYCGYDPASGRYALSPEQAAVLADENGPAYAAIGMRVAGALHKDEGRLRAAFTEGPALAWGDHDEDLFEGLARFLRGMSNADLVEAWIPALDGVQKRLRAGAKVAEIGSGYGATAIALAQAFPQSVVSGFDLHEASIEAARKAAAEAGVSDRVTFEVASADAFPGEGYDLVYVLDALHDMGDPVAVARHVRTRLADDGTWLLAEPRGEDRAEDTFTTVGRLFYAASTFICVPNALSQGGGKVALGAQAGPSAYREIVERAGFGRFRRIAEDAVFELVLEVRP